VLASLARLATGGRVGSDPPCAPGLARARRKIDWSRAVVDSCSIRAVYGRWPDRSESHRSGQAREQRHL